MRVLVLGAAGMLGHALCRTFATEKGIELFGTVRREIGPGHLLHRTMRAGTLSPLDVADTAAVGRLFEQLRPDVAINCVGVIKQRKGTGISETIRVNALFPHQVAEFADRQKCRSIFISTDCVFSGNRGRYSEDDLPDPVDVYGHSKLLGEVGQAPHLTIRSSLIGRELDGGQHGLLEWFRTRTGGVAEGYTEAYFSGLTTQAMSAVVLNVIQHHPTLTGVFHVASERISKFTLLEEINRQLGWQITMTRSSALRLDRSLNGRRFFEATGITVPSWNTMIEQLALDAATYA